MLADFYDLARSRPRDVFTVASGDRPRGGQPSSGPYPIAPEGQSNHQRYAYGKGLDAALDVDDNGVPIAYAVTSTELYAHGLQTPVPGDPVHLTRLGVNG